MALSLILLAASLDSAAEPFFAWPNSGEACNSPFIRVFCASVSGEAFDKSSFTCLRVHGICNNPLAMNDTYILDDHGNPVPCQDTLEWARWFETANRQLALTNLGDGQGVVSTVFLGIDLNFAPLVDPLHHHPILWETMVFGGPNDGEMRRYRSREDASAGHEEMVRRCTAPIS